MSKKPVKAADADGGNPSLDGWFYQCDVSVLAALDLLVVNRVAKVLQLEPASQEDLEAELEAPRVSSSAVVDGVRLVVQAKLRRSGQWTPASLRDLVEHGTKRLSALKLLDDVRVRYVLITSPEISSEVSRRSPAVARCHWYLRPISTESTGDRQCQSVPKPRLISGVWVDELLRLISLAEI